MKVGDLVRRSKTVWPNNGTVGVIVDVFYSDDCANVYFMVHIPDEEDGWWEQNELIAIEK